MTDKPKQPDATSADRLDDLLGLVAGTLDANNFERVSRAVAHDPLLLKSLQQVEQIREGVLRSQAPVENLSAIAATHATVLDALATSSQLVMAVKNQGHSNDPGFASWRKKCLSIFFRPSAVGFAYGLVVFQAAVIAAFTLTSAAPTDGTETSAMRGATQATDNKQLGTQQDNIFLTVSFAASTPESTFRALLLEIQADIVSGPNQLGQYRISVARNRSYLAQVKLREAEFVEQALEVKP